MYQIRNRKKDVREKNHSYAYKKHLTHVLKMVSIPCGVQFHAYHFKV